MSPFPAEAYSTLLISLCLVIYLQTQQFFHAPHLCHSLCCVTLFQWDFADLESTIWKILLLTFSSNTANYNKCFPWDSPEKPVMRMQKAWCAQAVSDELCLPSRHNCSESAMGRWAGLPRCFIRACAISLTCSACTGPVASFLYMQKAHLSGSFVYPAALSGHR